MDKKRMSSFICSHTGCFAEYYRRDRLEIHMRSHTGERPFMCAYDDCDKTFVRESHLRRHELIHEENNIRCSYEGCDIVFKTKLTLKRHIDHIHLQKKPKLYKCSYCDQQFNKHTWLKSHEYKHTSIKPYICSIDDCGKRFLMPSRLRIHQKVHQGYTCSHSDCGTVSQTWSLHLKHLRVNHSTTYECSTCSKVFRNKGNLKTHETTHLNPGERKCFSCPEIKCQKSYYEMKNLKHHIDTVHTGRPFKCNHQTCSLSFKTVDLLNKHFEQVHNPNVPLSSKKRKLKAKRKKKAKLTLAAKLAGLSDEPNSEEPDHHQGTTSELKKLEDFISSKSARNSTAEPKGFTMIEIFVNKATENTTYAINKEGYMEAFVTDATQRQSSSSLNDQSVNQNEKSNTKSATVSNTNILCC